MALVIFDTFKGHKGDEMESLLLENNIFSVIVPCNCTDLLQPLDLIISDAVFSLGIQSRSPNNWKKERSQKM